MKKTILSLILKEIKSGLLGLMIFFLAIFIGFESYSFFSKIYEVKTLVMWQVSSLASNKALTQDYLAIQPEVSRFVDSMKKALPYNVEVHVRLDGKLIAGESRQETLSPINTKIKSETKLPSGQTIEVTAEIFNGRALLEAIVLLFLICGSCGLAYLFLMRKMQKSVQQISSPLFKTISWVDALSSNLPHSLKERDSCDAKDIEEINLLNGAVGRMVAEIENLESKLIEAGKSMAKIEIAEQVGHDIRSPLATIDSIVRSSAGFSTAQREQIEKPIQRIMGVLNDLAPKKSESVLTQGVTSLAENTISVKPEFVFPIIKDIFLEKKLLHEKRSGITFSLRSKNGGIAVVSLIDRNEISRSVSNLLDNAVEAIDQAGHINIEIAATGSMAVIQISDTGKGIPPEVLAKVGTRTMTYGKQKGSGLGVYHTKETIEKIGGEFKIESELGQGTTVTLKIPLQREHKLIADSLFVSGDQPIVVVDDDTLIRNLWEDKAKQFDVKLVSFSSPEELVENFEREDLDRMNFIVDLEFKNSSVNGIDLIRKLQIEDRAILISGKWDTSDVAFQCEHFEIKRFPKELLSYFEIIKTDSTLGENDLPRRELTINGKEIYEQRTSNQLR